MKIHIRNIWTHLQGDLSKETSERLDNELSFSIPGGAFLIDGWENKQRAKLTQNAILKKQHELRRKLTASEILQIERYWQQCELPYTWDGRAHLWDKRGCRIPTGLLRRTLAILDEYKEDYQLIDKRIIPPKQFHWKLHDVELYEDQTQVSDSAAEKQRGIIQAATGWGKTIVIGALTAKLGRKTLILTHRETIFQQLYKRMYQMLKIPIGRIQGSTIELDAVTIGMIQTVANPKCLEILKNYDVLIVDECHHTPSDQYNQVMKNCTATFRYGFSATSFRESSDMLEIEAQLAGFICKISPSQLIKAGRLAIPHIYFLMNPANEKYEKLSWQKQYSYCIVSNDYRNSMVCHCAAHLWRNKKTVLIAVTRIDHGKILEKMFKIEYPEIKVKFINGSIESEEKQLALKMLDQKKLDIVIATTVFGEGVDVPNLDALINAKGNESRIETIQLLGRVLRKTDTKNHAFYIDFLDGEKYTKDHSKTRWNVLEKEPEFYPMMLRNVEVFQRQLKMDMNIK